VIASERYVSKAVMKAGLGKEEKVTCNMVAVEASGNLW
jgi:hypothetical protein